MRQKEVIPAEKEWIEANIREFSDSPFKRIGDNWMLIGAGDLRTDRGNWNAMTSSWGGLGNLWNTEAAFCFIRPNRHTFDFVNSHAFFSLSFFDPSWRKALETFGFVSGRDTDKAAAANLTPIVFEQGPGAGALGFKEAREVMICRKMYTHDFDPAAFLVPDEIEKNYPEKDYHRMFIGEIMSFRLRSRGSAD